MDKEEKTEEQKQINDYIRKRGRDYNRLAGEIATITGKSGKFVTAHVVESIKSLAIVSGALASFSILLLSSGVIENSIYSALLIVGIILLLLNTLFSFSYLLSGFTTASKGLKKLRESTYVPIQRRSYETILFIKGEISAKEWLEKEKDFLSEHSEISKEIAKVPEEVGLSHFDEFLIGIFILAISLIVISLTLNGLGPYIENLLSKLLIII